MVAAVVSRRCKHRLRCVRVHGALRVLILRLGYKGPLAEAGFQSNGTSSSLGRIAGMGDVLKDKPLLSLLKTTFAMSGEKGATLKRPPVEKAATKGQGGDAREPGGGAAAAWGDGAFRRHEPKLPAEVREVDRQGEEAGGAE